MNGLRFAEVLNEITDWFIRFVGTNFLWFLVNLPTAFFVLNLLLIPEKIGLFYLILPLLLSGIFLLFPGTIALFAMVRDTILKKESPSIIKSYFSYLKGNYKVGIKGGFLFCLLWLIWYGDYYYFTNILENQLFSYVMMILGLILFVYNLHFFSTSAHFHMGMKDLLKTSFYITIGRPLSFILILLSGVLIFYFSVLKFPFLIPLFSGSLIAYASFYLFFRLALPKQKQN